MNALALPSREPCFCVLQDRMFDARNQLAFPGGGMMEMVDGFLGRPRAGEPPAAADDGGGRRVVPGTPVEWVEPDQPHAHGGRHPQGSTSTTVISSREGWDDLRRIMEHSEYGLSVTLPVAFDTAVADATAALKAEGFGVLTSIDVQQTLKTKLNRDFRKYVILGACNPTLADRALHAELEIGLPLPCNVIVCETASDQSVVAAMAPLVALGIVGAKPVLQDVAREADERLRRALAALEAAALKK